MTPVLADTIYSLKDDSNISVERFYDEIPPNASVVLGEFHYNENIQKTQAKIIQAVVKHHQAENNFTIGWEFLNYTDNQHIQESYESFSNNEIDIFEFLTTNNVTTAVTYAPIFNVAKDLGANIVGTNIPRSIKRIITQSGIENLDPKYIPHNYRLGSSGYYERFVEAMGGHLDSDKIAKYYQAQCLTDSVISYQFNEQSKTDLKFLVIGSFHSDYFDGTVSALRELTADPVINIKVIDGATTSKEQLKELLKMITYGPIADFIYIATPE